MEHPIQHIKYQTGDVEVIYPNHIISTRKTNTELPLREIINYSNGQKHGLHAEWYPSNSRSYFIKDLYGRKMFEVNYVNGNMDGIYKSYHKNGNIDRICTYKDGLLHGEYKEYCEAYLSNAEKSIIDEISEDDVETRLITSCNYINGRLEGKYESWNHGMGSDSSTCSCTREEISYQTANYKEGRLHGELIKYNSDLEISESSMWKNNSLHGESKKYNDFNRLISTTHYNDYKKIEHIKYGSYGEIKEWRYFMNGGSTIDIKQNINKWLIISKFLKRIMRRKRRSTLKILGNAITGYLPNKLCELTLKYFDATDIQQLLFECEN